MKKFSQIISLLFLLCSLPLTLVLVQTSKYYFGKATGTLANISVDAALSQGPLVPIWQMLAQGGEEKFPLDQIDAQIANLSPKYIRIDHIFDFYDVVKKENGQLIYDFSQLDKVVNQIIQVGALPFFSLSYMPVNLAKDSQITNPPINWNDWSNLVKNTIQHYSGQAEKNLTNVAYEVWNEPDLFGNWRIGGEKDYRLLYQYTITGASQTSNTNPFKIGGPATTAPYFNWVDLFFEFTSQNHLRLDFYSWHRYSYNPKDFIEDTNRVDSWFFKNGGTQVEKYITEFGPDSGNNPIYNSNFAASHLVAVIRQLLGRVNGAFVFEIKDGVNSNWGLLTHEDSGFVKTKPRYQALKLLNLMKGSRLLLEGEGSWVTGFAAKENNTYRIILTNTDLDQKHQEAVPIIITNLENGDYLCKEVGPRGQKGISLKTIFNNTLTQTLLLEPNEILLLEIEKK